LSDKREFDEVDELIAQSRDVAAEYDSEIFIPDSFLAKLFAASLVSQRNLPISLRRNIANSD